MISVSNILIIISSIFTFTALFNPEIYVFWMNDFYLNQGKYHLFLVQFFTSNFLHGSFFHLFMNSIFLYYFWNIVEMLLGRKRYVIFFITSVFFIGISILIFGAWNTIWISGFCMALLTYYTFELKRQNNPEYKWGITAIIINVWIWLTPQISLVWHLFWAIYGFIYNKLTQKKIL